MSLIVVNGKRVENLGILKVYDNKNNREYNFVLSDNIIEYYEILRNQYGVNYVSYGKNALDSNAPASLRALKERLFMQFFADELNTEYKIKNLSSTSELSEAVRNMQQVLFEEGPDKLKVLFKADADSLIDEGRKLFNYLNIKRKARMTRTDMLEKKKNVIEFKDADINNSPFTVSIPKQQIEKAKEERISEFEDISPTLILNNLNEVSRSEVIKETRKEEPSTEILGFETSPKQASSVSNLIGETLERKEMPKYQSDYLEAVKDNLDQQVATEKTIKVDNIDTLAKNNNSFRDEDLLPRIETKREVEPKKEDLLFNRLEEKNVEKATSSVVSIAERIKNDLPTARDFDDTLSFTKVKEEPDDDETLIFANPVKEEKKPVIEDMDNTVTSIEEYKKLMNQPKTEEVDGGKQKTIGKQAAYVDTVILCLLVQLGIFGLLIFVLLLIK